MEIMKVLYVKCNSTRIKMFQLKTIIYEENGQKFVKKEALCDEAIPHLMKMKENYKKLKKTIVDPNIHFANIIAETEKSLIFEFVDGLSMEQCFLNAQQNNIQEANRIIADYISLVKNGFQTKDFAHQNMEENYTQVFGEGDYEKLEGKACFDRVSNCDLIPSNILYKDNKIYIIDYEWVFDFSVPVEYIYFRGLNLFQDKTLVQQYIDNEIVEELFRQEDHFILQYVLRKESFYQIQHYYLKNKISIIEELQIKHHELQAKDQQITHKDHELQVKDQEILYLKEIAQSMRIKNRIKRFLPKQIISYLENSKVD